MSLPPVSSYLTSPHLAPLHLTSSHRISSHFTSSRLIPSRLAFSLYSIRNLAGSPWGSAACGRRPSESADPQGSGVRVRSKGKQPRVESERSLHGAAANRSRGLPLALWAPPGGPVWLQPARLKSLPGAPGGLPGRLAVRGEAEALRGSSFGGLFAPCELISRTFRSLRRPFFPFLIQSPPI